MAATVPIPANGVCYRRQICLAPMVRSGELPSRLVALHYGADLVWGPETIDKAIIGARCRHNATAGTLEFTRTPSSTAHIENPPESVIYRIHPARESSRLIFQLGSASPSLAVEAARVVAPHVAGIDLNSGCPKPFSTSGGMGAALLSTPDLLCDILKALVTEVGTPFEIGISVKIRLLKTEAETIALVERLCQTGITGLTIHCRTRAMRKSERAIRDQLAAIGNTCRAAGVACVMNGDVTTRADAEKLVAEYGVDGAMIAEAAEKNLSVFSKDGPAPWEEVVRKYFDEALAVENRWGNTKFLLAQLIPGREQIRAGVGNAKNNADMATRLGLDDMLERARHLDEIAGITDRLTKSEQKARKQQLRQESVTNAAAATNQQDQHLRKRPRLDPPGEQHPVQPSELLAQSAEPTAAPVSLHA